MTDLAILSSRNSARWAAAKITRATQFAPVAKRLTAPAAKSRYLTIAGRTGVPWFVIAVIHEREASQRFDRQLGQGDPLNKRSTHVPVGLGPFTGPMAFEDAAVDALTKCAPYASGWKDWTAGGALTLLEQYNGLGYANKGLPSPYVWAGTDQYTKGKYVADGVFDPDAVDKQLGCAGLILAMKALDPSIAFGPVNKPPPDIEPPVPSSQPKTVARNTTTAGTVVAGSILAAAKADSIGIAVAIVLSAIVIAVAVHLLWPKKD